MKAAAPLLLLVGIALAPPAAGQEPTPSPPPERLFQDELDLQANANFVQGSGARAFGMGGAFLARADDATAASWNPAGLSYLKAPELSFVYVDADFESRSRGEGVATIMNEQRPFVQNTRDDRAGGFPDFMALTWPWEARGISGAAQISYQRVVPFTSSRTITDIVTDTTSNQVEQTTRVVESTGGFDVVAFGTGLRLSRKLRLGLAVNRWLNGYKQVVDFERFVPSHQVAWFDLGGWNLHLGAIVSPWESLNLGVVLKTAFAPEAALRREREDVFPFASGRVTTNAYFRDDLTLRLPASYGIGASWRPRSNLTLSLDYTRTDFSGGQIEGFFTLARRPPFTGTEPAPTPPESGDYYPLLPYPTLDDTQQQDTEQLRAGVEYVVIKSRLKWPIRVGYFSDRQFFRSLDGNAPRFDGYTAGTGLILGPTLLDVAYVYSTGKYTDRSGVHNDVKSQKLYASVIYRHPRRR